MVGEGAVGAEEEFSCHETGRRRGGRGRKGLAVLRELGLLLGGDLVERLGFAR